MKPRILFLFLIIHTGVLCKPLTDAIIYAKPGDSATLDCNGEIFWASGIYSVEWLKKGRFEDTSLFYLVRPSPKYFQNFARNDWEHRNVMHYFFEPYHEILLPNVTVKDEGTYICLMERDYPHATEPRNQALPFRKEIQLKIKDDVTMQQILPITESTNQVGFLRSGGATIHMLQKFQTSSIILLTFTFVSCHILRCLDHQL